MVRATLVVAYNLPHPSVLLAFLYVAIPIGQC